MQPRKLDRTRPLWEVYYVEGLQGGRVAIVTKTHHALIDGVHALDIAHVIVDSVRGEGLGEHGEDLLPWEPKTPPSSAELVAGAFVDAVRRPTQVVDQVRGGLNEALNVVLRAIESAGTVVSAVPETRSIGGASLRAKWTGWVSIGRGHSPSASRASPLRNGRKSNGPDNSAAALTTPGSTPWSSK